MNKDEVGRAGEDLAAELVAGLGYQVLDRNWRTAVGQRRSGERRNQGELDLVALDGHTLVGIEVKTRSTTAYGHPAEAFTPQKVARMKRLLGQWLAEHRNNRPHFTEIRLDAIAILLNPAPQITHFKGIS
jgi:putative endonuclease